MQYDLEMRLIAFSVSIIGLEDSLSKKITISTQVLLKQILRYGISPALNYAEAQGAESDRDFLHKMKICLNELRET